MAIGAEMHAGNRRAPLRGCAACKGIEKNDDRKPVDFIGWWHPRRGGNVHVHSELSADSPYHDECIELFGRR